MDPDFSLKPAKRSPLEEQVRTMARRSFFDSVRQDFANNDFARHVPVFIEEIRDSLLAMMSGKSKHAENIKEVLDVALIRQQIDNKTFDILGCLSYITQKMLQLCAPIRDAAIRAIVSSADLGTAFEKILDILEDMKLDLANYRLQALRPVLQQQAVEYEQTKFNEALASGVVSLVKTKAWLEAAVASLKAINAARNPENIQLPQNRVGYEEAYNEALLGLIFSNTPVSPADMAETMLLDADRLFGFQNEAQATTIVAALVMLSKNAVRELREHRPGLTKLKETLFILLQDKGTNVDNLALHIIQTINESLARPGQTQPKISSEQETLIRNMVEKTLSYKDPVFSLLNRRIQTAIKYQLEKGQFKSESLASHGLDCVEKELQELSVRICRLAKHNKEVYAKHYDDILSKTVQ
ncbi:T-complex 11 [Phlyctochytrium arcticum]|nr:T-complex 11 [Phlyctochytrium arcticum]